MPQSPLRMLPDYLLTILIISAFCVGWFHLTRQGAILGFFETFFLYLHDQLEKSKNIFQTNGLPMSLIEIGVFKFLLWSTKPIIGCCKCFASFWGVIVCYALNGYDLKMMIVCCIASVFVNVLFLKWTES